MSTRKVFTALYRRHYVNKHEDFNSKKKALKCLEDGMEYNELFSIAIIHDNKMVWFEEFLGKEKCQELVDEFLKTKLPV